jgi:hypothetical protein
MTSNITIFKNIKETQTPFYRNITDILERIKVGASKDLVKEIRSEKDKTKSICKSLNPWRKNYDFSRR